MKLCFLAGANSIHSQKWIKYFADKGHEIHWISLTPNIFGNIKNVRFYLMRQFPVKLLDIIFNALPVRRLLRKINPDIFHVHYAGVNGVIGALSGFHPFLLTSWGSDVLIAPKSKVVKPLIKFALKKADLITCDAEHMKEAIIKLGVNSSQIQIVYFGVDTQKFSPGPENEELKSKLGLSNRRTIISLRNLEPVYDLETLIKSVPLVLKEIPEAKFIIVGKGSEEEKLKNLAQNLKVSESIRFVGWISNDELPQYLRSVDIYVSTSLSDAGLSACTAEAMACQVPVVITNTGENEKWVKDGENGFIIPVENPEMLAGKIIYLLKNEDIAKKFGGRSRKLIEERNNYYKEMEKVENVYKGIMEKQ